MWIRDHLRRQSKKQKRKENGRPGDSALIQVTRTKRLKKKGPTSSRIRRCRTWRPHKLENRSEAELNRRDENASARRTQTGTRKQSKQSIRKAQKRTCCSIKAQQSATAAALDALRARRGWQASPSHAAEWVTRMR